MEFCEKALSLHAKRTGHEAVKKKNRLLPKRLERTDDHLPLVVKGAKQVGKTASIMQFAHANYMYVVAVNFVLQQKYKAIFDDGFLRQGLVFADTHRGQGNRQCH